MRSSPKDSFCRRINTGLTFGIHIFLGHKYAITWRIPYPVCIIRAIIQIRNSRPANIPINAEKGIYEYNAKKDSFEKSEYFKGFFKQRNVRYLKEDADGNIWFIEEKNLSVVDLSGSQPKIIYFPELNGTMVSGFEHINPFNKFNVFVGAEKGFYNINYEQYKKNHYAVQKNKISKSFWKNG